MPTARYNLMTEDKNDTELAHNLTVDKIRDGGKVTMAAYQQAVIRSYNKHIKVKQFQVGD